jgi:hypothetical protein
MKSLIKFFLIFFIIFTDHLSAREAEIASWSKNSKASYNECNFIFSFICTMTKDVKSDVNIATINTFIAVYNFEGKMIKKFKVKKIEYNKSKGLCWLTPQPIRGYTTYFVTDRCFAK